LSSQNPEHIMRSIRRFLGRADLTPRDVEILYPVAVVILGGLISSTVLNMVVLPSIFYKFGRSSFEKGFTGALEDEEITLETPGR